MELTTKESGAAVDVDELKGMVRELAAGVPRPVLLHELVGAIAGALGPRDVRAIVETTVEAWVISLDEPVKAVAAGTLLCGPAASADDADAWDDFAM